MKLEIPSKRKRAATDTTAAQGMIREAFPVAQYGNAKAAIWAAYRRLKLRTERRARALWNGEATRVDAWEMDALTRALLERARLEHERTEQRIRALEAALGIPRKNEVGAGD